jgi:hypothetical protein
MIPWDEFWPGVAQAAIIFGLIVLAVGVIAGLGLLIARWMS